MTTEYERRASLADQVYAYVRSRPHVWLSMRELMAVGGLAWRSRLPAVRARLQAEGDELIWNGQNGGRSAYMLRPRRLGRDAGEYRTQAGLF